MIDELPALAVAAAFAEGVTEVRDAAELAVKESDRIGTIEQELTQLGIGVETRADGLAIRGGARGRARSRATATTGSRWRPRSRPTPLDGETTVRGWPAVAISYPGFADDLAAVDRARRP